MEQKKALEEECSELQKKLDLEVWVGCRASCPFSSPRPQLFHPHPVQKQEKIYFVEPHKLFYVITRRGRQNKESHRWI